MHPSPDAAAAKAAAAAAAAAFRTGLAGVLLRVRRAEARLCAAWSSDLTKVQRKEWSVEEPCGIRHVSAILTDVGSQQARGRGC